MHHPTTKMFTIHRTVRNRQDGFAKLTSCIFINTMLGMGDSSNEREGDHDSLKRSVRPNFAEDVYGEKKGTQTEEVEYSESSLAQRRSALLVKLKQLKDSHGTTTTDANVNRAESVDMNDCDIEFDYNDCDTLLNELAELYTYSELDDFASNIQCWKVYADNNELVHAGVSNNKLPTETVLHLRLRFTIKRARSLCHVRQLLHSTQSRAPDVVVEGDCGFSDRQYRRSEAAGNAILPPFHFSSLPLPKRMFIIQDLCARMESAEPDVRLASARIMLYILQGAYLDFSDEEEVEAGVPLRATTLDKGTGDHEGECLVNAFLNAHLAYKAGAYQALCTLLMAEICEPFDSGLAATTDGGRESKASSRGSRCPSSADLAESDRRNRRAATMADNEAMRAVISALYHMVELIRNQDMTEKLSAEDPSLAARRSAFLAELSEPLDHVGQPLLLVLFEMLPPFYTGASPHYPIKKILLLIWKILLATLGGWRHLDMLKTAKRTALGLPVMENTIAVASSLPATVINDTES
ncbi:n1221-like protein, partial [Ancylostoma duodenale]